MERADLLEANGQIFKPQGQALNEHAADDIKVLVVGNPANTNALIAQQQRARHPRRALHRDDTAGREPRGRPAGPEARHGVEDIQDLCVWGNHSPTMFPDLFNAKAGGSPAIEQVRRDVVRRGVHPARGQARRGDHRGPRRVSAASAANAAIDHVRDWVLGADGLRSMAVTSDGSYGVEEGLMSSFPVRGRAAGRTPSSRGSRCGDFARARIDTTVNELKEERDAVRGLGARRRPAASSRASHGPPCGPARPSAAREHAVQVVLLDPHRLGDLGDRDARARAHELERLLGAGAAPRAGARAAPRWRAWRRRPLHASVSVSACDRPAAGPPAPLQR